MDTTTSTPPDSTSRQNNSNESINNDNSSDNDNNNGNEHILSAAPTTSTSTDTGSSPLEQKGTEETSKQEEDPDDVSKSSSSSSSSSSTFQHDFKTGDHVIRWTRIVVYPIQIHGIVMSAGEDMVTIVDFGLSSSHNASPKSSSNDGGINNDDEQNNQEMIQAIEKEHDYPNRDRINIITITEEKDIEQWKKVNYGEELSSNSKKWKWWWQSSKEEEKDNGKKDKEKGNNEDDDDKQDVMDTSSSLESVPNDQPGKVSAIETNETSLQAKNENTEDNKENNQSITKATKPAKAPPTSPPKLPKSDPAHMVVSRVRFLLENPSSLPEYHILYSNSECIAVWCKTGRWSTLQATIYLTSTAAGNFKSAATLATVIGTTTVTQTVPAGGIAGFFGMTTTTTVGLVSVQPWLIPVVAGYGLLAVGTPLFVMQKAKERWEVNTINLTDRFWAWADVDVYVDAIRSWSAVGP